LGWPRLFLQQDETMLTGLIGLAAAFGSTVLVLFPLIHRLRSQRWRRWLAWGMMVALLLLAATIARPWAVGWRIVATWTAAYLGFKALLLLHTPAGALTGLTWWRYLGFTNGWLGMDVEPWTMPAARMPGAIVRQRLIRGLVVGLAGALALLLILSLRLPERWRLAQAWCAFVAGVIATFFGATGLLTAFWNSLGRAVRPLFDQPVYASSLSDWWGKRWNLSVHMVLTLVIWQPLRERIGAAWAATAVFAVSGVLHEYLLSYPARGGWGGPTAYFAVQAAGMYAERQRPLRRWLRKHHLGQISWTLGITLLPGPLLFHPALLRALLGPFLD
jgi:hypothetical protein